MARRSRSGYVESMYCPPAFREDRPEVLRAAMQSHPLATLVTTRDGDLAASIVPFIVERVPEGFVLRAHLARANGQLLDLRAGASALVIFQGPQAYVSPSWYASKLADGKVVPTWNYVVVQVRGVARVIDDPAWLLDHLEALTASHEAGQAAPWTPSDAPPGFIRAQVKGIAGVEIPLDRIEGKWKVSQNRAIADRAGVARGLRDAGHDAAAALVPLS